MLSSKLKKIACLAGIAIVCTSLNIAEPLAGKVDSLKLPNLFLYEKTVPRLNLSPVQKDKFKKNIKSYKANRIRLTAQLKVAEVEFSELIEKQPLSLATIKAQVDLISDIKKKMAENYVDHLIKTKSLLTDKQLTLFKRLIQKKP